MGYLIILAMLISPSLSQTLQEKLAREKAAMDSLETSLEKNRELLDRTAIQKMSTVTQLDRLQREEVEARRELRGLSAKEKTLQSRVQRTRNALARAERRLNDRQTGIAERLRTSYKLSRQDPLAVLFSGSSLSEGMRRLRYLSLAAHQDRVDLASLKSAKDEVRGNLRLSQVQHTHQQALVRSKQKQEQKRRSSVLAFNSKLQMLERKEENQKEALRDLNEEKAQTGDRIAQLIQEIERQRLAGRRLATLPAFDFKGKKGALPWPVKGPALTTFGRVRDPELGTWTVNRGITIGATAETDVLAIAPGEVMLVDWWRGYGQLVLLRHPQGYYTLYSHLASRNVEEGEILDVGALIGAVGSTGRLDNVPQLHFEIMEGEHALDPKLWLANE